MQFSFNMNQNNEIMNDMNSMYNMCASHVGCVGCKLYNGGQPIQIGNSVFVCENMGKGVNNGSEV